MADAGFAEGRSFNLHSAGTDLTEGSALAIKSASGAIAVDGATVGGAVALYITDPVAHDAVDAGNPQKIGGYAKGAAPTAVADGDRVNAWFGLTGALNTTLRDVSGSALLGQGTMAASLPITIASNQSAISVSLSTALDSSIDSVTVTGSVGVTGTFWQATQPVSGTVAVSGSVAVTDNAGSLTVDAPVATPVYARLSDGAAALIGQKAMTASLPVVLASDQSALAVAGTFWQATQPVSGTVTANVGTGTQPVSGTFWQATQPVSGAFWQATQPVSIAANILTVGPTAADAALTVSPVTIGARASLAVPTAMSADGDVVNAWFDRYGRQHVVQKAGTSALTNVASSATTVTVVAANTARIGATVWNDSTAILYLKFGATASSTSATVKLAAGAYFEFPVPCYSGVVDGLWASANGSARITELT